MLLMMVMLLGFVVIMIGQAMKPETWAWFADPNDTNASKKSRKRDTTPDTRISTPPHKTPIEGQFTLALAETPTDVPQDSPGYFPGVRPELFDRIEENREFNSAELAPRVNLIDVLKRTDAKELSKASVGETGFLQLNEQPHVYRGKLVTVVGEAKQANYERSTVKDGVDQYFVIWLRPKGGPARPIVVYCLEKPEGFPEGKSLNEPVRITGFFFKRRAYAAQDTFRTVPAVFAKTFSWKPPVEKPGWRPTDAQVAWMFGGAIGCALLVVVVVHFRSRQLFASRRNEDVSVSLGGEQVLPSVGEQLTELADSEQK
ncbi:MAG: hypothetical protein MI757_21685 [Pirellulales bacterium]|nr:hypothetical protein [Pirellulales bacterium]